MKLTPEKRADVLAKAKAATQGTWFVPYDGGESVWVRTKDGAEHYLSGAYMDENAMADAAHIASADPKTVIALVEEVAQLASEVDAREAWAASQDETIRQQAAEIERLQDSQTVMVGIDASGSALSTAIAMVARDGVQVVKEELSGDGAALLLAALTYTERQRDAKLAEKDAEIERLTDFVSRCAFGDHPDEIPEDAIEFLGGICEVPL